MGTTNYDRLVLKPEAASGNALEAQDADGNTTHRVDEGGIVGHGTPETVASAAAIAPTKSLISLTGTTAVTSITVGTLWQAGDELTIIFAGSITLTDGNNLSLAGNFVATAGDVWKGVYDGTNFLEISRSDNG